MFKNPRNRRTTMNMKMKKYKKGRNRNMTRQIRPDRPTGQPVGRGWGGEEGKGNGNRESK